MKPEQIVEAVLFASDAPLRSDEIARADESLDEDVVEEAIGALRTLYLESERAFDLVELGEGYQILTRPEFVPYLDRFDTIPRPSRLSGPALEALAIIAYRQPIGRLEVEYVRGVGSSGVIRTLQDRGLVEVVGRAEGLGRPLLYGTTARFLQHFGFRTLDDLPRPEELSVLLRDRSHPILPEEDEGEDEEAEPANEEAEDADEETEVADEKAEVANRNETAEDSGPQEGAPDEAPSSPPSSP